jgi:hypothetical protein
MSPALQAAAKALPKTRQESVCMYSIFSSVSTLQIVRETTGTLSGKNIAVSIKLCA